MAGGMKLLAVVVGLLFLVPDTMQLSFHHPLRNVLQRLNANEGPFLGLVATSTRYEQELLDSSDYEADSSLPSMTIAGRQFNFGKFNGEPVISVPAGEPLANVGTTVQILIDNFNIKGIISFGSAGTISNQVFISDVVIPAQVAYHAVWRWEKLGSELKKPSLKFGDYNLPVAGKNSLEHVTILRTQQYTPTSVKKGPFFLDVHPEWIQLASRLNFGERPTVHIGEGVRVGSSDIYVANVDYANFLNKVQNITAVDRESAAVVATSTANGVPHIVFRGTSNRPGTEGDERLSDTTAKNVLKTVAVFMSNLPPKTNTNFY